MVLFLTGKQGLAPSIDWDPLEFAIVQAHKRGLDLHAWINPFRARHGNTIALAKIIFQFCIQNGFLAQEL